MLSSLGRLLSSVRHSCFRKYIWKIARKKPRYHDCNAPKDTAIHDIQEHRRLLVAEIGKEPSLRAIVKSIIESTLLK